MGIHATIQNGFINFYPPSKITEIEIANACSGGEGEIIFLGLAAGIFIDLRKFIDRRKIIAYILIAVVCLYIVNAFRVVGEVLIGYYYGVGLMDFMHVYGGSFIFIPFSVIFFYLVLRNVDLNKAP